MSVQLAEAVRVLTERVIALESKEAARAKREHDAATSKPDRTDKPTPAKSR